MAKYKIEISATAERQLKKLPIRDRPRIVRAVVALAEDPYPRGARKLSGYKDVLRIRVGVYRILYSVERGRLTIIVLKISHRRDIYK